MSWSEIKKAVNSNIDVPLNELIDKQLIEKHFNDNPIQMNIGNATVSTSLTQIFSLNGHALLYGVMASLKNASNNFARYYELEIDGDTKYRTNYTAQQSSTYNGIGIGVETLFLLHSSITGSGTSANGLIYAAIPSDVNQFIWRTVEIINNPTGEISYTNYNGGWVLLDTPLEIKTSMSLKAKYTYSGAECPYYVMYKLLD